MLVRHGLQLNITISERVPEQLLDLIYYLNYPTFHGYLTALIEFCLFHIVTSLKSTSLIHLSDNKTVLLQNITKIFNVKPSTIVLCKMK